MSGSKFDQATKNARGREAARNGSTEIVKHNAATAPEVFSDTLNTGALVEQFDPEVFADGIADGTWDAAPQILTLEAGQMIQGILVGNGPVAEFEEIKQGVVEKHEVQTWIIKSPTSGIRVSILSSAQLDAKLRDRVGQYVMIARGPERDTKKGKRVTEYLVKSRALPASIGSAIDTTSA